jgi:5-methylcytosine-specific restriction enzyme B
MFVSEELLEESILTLNEWAKGVSKQNVPHVWSFLPVKLKGGGPGQTINYREEDDKAFLDRFFNYRAGAEPFFDPIRREWLKAGYAHSNAATFRKRTFMMSWKACTWDDSERLTLAENYHQIVSEKVLTKGGEVNRIPVLPLAVWFYKRPTAEWSDHAELVGGVPNDPVDLVERFRSDFNFTEDPGWSLIFETDTGLAKYLDAADG